MTVLRLILPLAGAGLILSAAAAHAQGAFPAPMPSQAAPTPASTPSAFPPVNSAPASSFPAPAAGAPPFLGGGGAPPGMGGFGAPPQGAPQEDCMKNFLPLRQDAEKKGLLLKTAGERKVPPDEACKLLVSFSGAETKMMKFIEANAKKCGIPDQIDQQMKAGHAQTEKMKTMVCNAAQQRAQGAAAAAPSLSDALGTSSAMPEVQTTKKGGSTFDTLSGNALIR